MLKYSGFFLIALSAFLFSRTYAERRKRRLLELDEFISFIKHIKVEISQYLRPRSEWLFGFSSQIFEDCGFSQRLGDPSLSLGVAFSESLPALSLGEEEREVLCGLFSSLGKSYLNDELLLIDKTLASLFELREKSKDENGKSIKIVNTLSAALSLGIIILLL